MNYTEYAEVDRIADSFYADGKYAEALALLEDTAIYFPDDYFDIQVYQAAIYIQLAEYTTCFHVIRKLVEQGYLCPLHSSWLKPIRNQIGFQSLEVENNRLRAEAQAKAEMKYEVHFPEDYAGNRTYPLIIVLHGDGGGSNLQDFSKNWPPDSLLKKGFIVVYIQSSQVMYHNNFGWLPNPEIAYADITACYQIISQQYTIDSDNIILGGFSGGAITTLSLILHNKIPARGFICLCPDEKPEGLSIENAQHAAARGVRGVLLEGEKALPMPVEEEMMAIFKQADLAFDYYLNEGIAHWFPTDLDQKLDRALAFITG